MDENRMYEQIKAFREVVLNEDSTLEEIAKTLLDCEVLFVGASQIDPPVKRDGGWFGSVGCFSCEECETYINIFTEPEAAMNWQKHFGRHLGALYKEDDFNGVFDVAYLCRIPVIWVNEGYETGVFVDTSVIRKIRRDSMGSHLFVALNKDEDASNGLQIGLNRVKCQLITFDVIEE